MKKVITIASIVTVVILSVAAYHSCNSAQVESKNKSAIVQTESTGTVPSNWKTYTHDRIGITFQYPDKWMKNGEESNAINRDGNVMSTMINLIDTISHSRFFLEYHLAPYGAELYKNAEAQFNSSQSNDTTASKQIVMLAGNKALESSYTMYSDIKGHIYDPPLRITRIILLDKQRTGEITLRFQTPLPNADKEVTKFKQLLSTFKFTN